MRRDVWACGHEGPKVRRDGLLAGMRARRVQLGVPGAIGRSKGLSRHRADDVRGGREHLGVVQREAADRGHHLRSIDQRHALFRRELDRLEPGRLERLRSRAALPFGHRFAFADQHQRGVRERGEVAGRSDAPVSRDDRMDPPIQHVAKQVDHVCSHAGMSGRERIRAEQQDRAHHVFGKRGADAHRVASHEVTLQSAQIPVRHAHSRKIAETGVHAVDGIVTLGDLRDHLGRLLYLTLRGAIEAYRDVAARDRDDVRDREIVPGEAEGRYFRFSRYQRLSSV